MKKSSFFMVGIFFSYLIKAQSPITIGSSDMPNVSDNILVSVNNTIGLNDPALTGANFNWDFTFLSPTMQQNEVFDSPLSFTTPYNFLFNPFNTSYGRDNYEFSTIPLPGAQISAAYDFYKESSSDFKQIGAGYTINDVPIPFSYSQEDIIYKFPINYLNTESCDYKYGFEIPGVGYYGQSGHRINTVDGWGTLTTPFGTFQTLRITSTIDAVDTVYNTALLLGTNIPNPLKYEYKWLANGMKIPVLKIKAVDILGTVTVNDVRYIDSTRAGVPQVGIFENIANNEHVMVYPIPCINELVLQYNLQNTTLVNISITNVFGSVVAILFDEIQIAGDYKKSINITDLQLSSGIYFLNHITNNHKEIRKIVVAQ